MHIEQYVQYAILKLLAIKRKNMKTIIAATFITRETAEELINKLHQTYGINNNDISFVYKNTEGEIIETETEDIAEKTAIEGAEDGAKIGGAAGALAGIAVIAGVIPVIGPIAAGGALAASLGLVGAVGTVAGGAAVGAAAGGLIGALVNMGFSENDAQVYNDAVLVGDVMVAVVDTNNRADDIRQLMIEHGGTNITTTEVSL